MALLFRSAWQDDGTDLGSVAAEAFANWVNEKECGPCLITDLRDLDSDAQRQALADSGDAAGFIYEHTGILGLRCRLTEVRDSETWTTTLRVSLDQDTGEQWIGVDVDWTAIDPFRRIHIAAPRLVRNLITESRQRGNTPLIGSAILSGDAEGITTPDQIRSRIAPLIVDPDRRIPVVLFSHDPAESGGQTAIRAHRAAERLAGVAVVYLLTPPASNALDRQLGENLSVWPGAARLYLPGDLDPWRHRFLTRHFVQSHDDAAAKRFALMLKDFVPAIELPAPLQDIDPSAALDSSEADRLDQIARVLQDTRQELIAANRRAKELESQYYWTLDDQRAAQEEADRLRNQLMAARRQQQNVAGNADNWEMLVSPTTVEDAIRLGNERLPFVAIHPNAPKRIDDLDEALESETWAKSIWLGLCALNEYAQRPPNFSGGFWEWCEHGAGNTLFAWPASNKKLAMDESETLKSDERFNRTRLMPIDVQVSSNGTKYMYAHLKISEGGGQNIPRLYFHDDTRRHGGTGKIHIGFIGPHKEVPNTRRS